MGATVHQEALYDDARLRTNWQAIEDALEAVGHTRIRRMITVGGSVGPLIGGFDLPIALLALRARVNVAGPAGTAQRHAGRRCSRRGSRRTRWWSSVEVDPQPARTGSSFYKYMARGVLEIPTVNTAAAVELDDKGRLHPRARGRGRGQLEAHRPRSASSSRASA